ncbi:MAG: Outer membrane protein TolC precursor [Syntrophus sp. PtaU1.Bin208]|nr:MAG: Outer membrane protein TolC precursor [Syntrophus sp. PtaU1.Bin208]
MVTTALNEEKRGPMLRGVPIKSRLRSPLVSILTFFLVLTAFPVQAWEQAFSLPDAVRYALSHNSEIRVAESSLAAKRDEVGLALSNLLPRIFFEERYLRTNNPTYAFMAKLNQGRFTQQDFAIDSLNNPSAVDDYQTQLGFEQPLFVPKAWIGLDLSKREHEAGRSEFTRRKEEIAFQVCRAWFNVHTAKAHLDVAEKGVADAREHFRIAQLRYEADLAMVADTLRAGTALAEARQHRVTAEKQFNLARRMLGLLLGLSEPVDVTGKIPDFEIHEMAEYEKISQSREDVRSLALRSENAEKNVRLSESDYLPTVGVGGGWQWNDPSHPFGGEGDSWQVMAFLRWNLFDGTRREYERSKAKNQARQVREQLQGMKNAVAYGLYQAQLGLAEAKANLELAREALKTAEEGKRLVQMRYENAFSPIVDLLDTQVVLDRARAGLVARENEYRIAILNLGWESGTILPDLGIEAEGRNQEGCR